MHGTGLVTAALPEGARVMLEGMLVTRPGFWGTQFAQIPAKQERPAPISDLVPPQASMQDWTLFVNLDFGQ